MSATHFCTDEPTWIDLAFRPTEKLALDETAIFQFQRVRPRNRRNQTKCNGQYAFLFLRVAKAVPNPSLYTLLIHPASCELRGFVAHHNLNCFSGVGATLLGRRGFGS